jgi:hypothetical protein
MAWEAPLPDDMKNLLLLLRRQSNKSDFGAASVSV